MGNLSRVRPCKPLSWMESCGRGETHCNEAEEPHQMLFSWAEFMAEGADQAEGPQTQDAARNHLDVQVGADA